MAKKAMINKQQATPKYSTRASQYLRYGFL